ncbi:hypothetical protein [Serratia liquefaciens]
MKKALLIISLIASASVFSNTVAAKVICFEDGTCYDIGDPSTHP